MTTKAFIIVLIAVAALVAGAVYMHQPRQGPAAGGFSLHGAPRNR
jgi:preprotein translocase subunit SecG